MSGTGEIAVVDGIEGPEGRRSRRESPARSMTEIADANIVLEAGGDTGPTPEEALADAEKALRAKDDELAAATTRANTAEHTAAQARDAAARERTARQTDRQAAVKSQNEAAQADKATAQQMKRAAREAGDLDAELKADDMLASANYRLDKTKDELDQLAGGGEMRMEDARPGTGGGQQQHQGMAPESVAWIEAHPRFKTDKGYKQAALTADSQCVIDGIIRNSPAYFRELNKAVADYEGADGNNGGEHVNNRNNGGRRPASSEGAPPSRGNGGHGGAPRMVKTPLGTLTVSRRNDGKLAIQIPPGSRQDFEEGAKVTGMSLGEYAHEQVKIADEVAAGGNGGLITEEGSIYR